MCVCVHICTKKMHNKNYKRNRKVRCQPYQYLKIAVILNINSYYYQL